MFLFSPGLWPWEVWDLFLNAFWWWWWWLLYVFPKEIKSTSTVHGFSGSRLAEVSLTDDMFEMSPPRIPPALSNKHMRTTRTAAKSPAPYARRHRRLLQLCVASSWSQPPCQGASGGLGHPVLLREHPSSHLTPSFKPWLHAWGLRTHGTTPQIGGEEDRILPGILLRYGTLYIWYLYISHPTVLFFYFIEHMSESVAHAIYWAWLGSSQRDRWYILFSKHE